MVTNYDTTLEKPKITNGSLIIIGGDNNQQSLNIVVDKHFNQFQKKMIRWCFGFEVVNYKEK